MPQSLLTSMVIVFALAIASMYFCVRLRIPTIVGLLLTGVAAGSGGLGLISVSTQVESIADIGVVLLLFTIGLEFSLKKLLRVRRLVLLGGSLQVFLTTGIVYLFSSLAGYAWNQALFWGFIISMSSTAIAMKLLEERREIEGPAGSASLGISLFQDIMSVPMVLSIPLLVGADDGSGSQLGFFFLKSAVIIILVFIGARWIIPYVLYQVTRTRSRELFLLSVLGICGLIAWLTSLVGLSLALGAFLAGLIISESEYSHQALGSILPFRDVFTGFFFISIGMLLDVGFFVQHAYGITLLALGIVGIKIIIIIFTCVILGLPLKTGVLTGFALSNIGEFSFVLIRTGSTAGLLPDATSQFFLAVTVISMILAPFLMAAAPGLTAILLRLPGADRLRTGIYGLSGIMHPDSLGEKKDHIIIVGFGINGRNVAKAALIAGIPYVIIEINPDTVRDEQSKGEHIIFGSADQPEVLKHAGIADAKVLVISIADPAITRHVTVQTRKANPDLYIIARTRFIQEVQPLYGLGANEVIPEEFETSIEIFTRVLKKYLIPHDEIRRFVADIRAGGYVALRDVKGAEPSCGDLSCYLAGEDISALRVFDDSSFAGMTLSKAEIRRKFDIAVIAIRRNDRILSNPSADTQIKPGDILICLGAPGKVEEFARLLNPHGDW